MQSKHGRRLGGLLAMFLTALCALSGTAGAADKDYAAAFDATQYAAGSRPQVTVTITNTSRNQQLGSFNLGVPEALRGNFALVSPPSGVTYANGVVSGRNLGILPKSSSNPLKFTMAFDAPCASSSQSWPLQVKQSNDFNGSGNDLAGPRQVATSVTGSCGLQFGTQPQDAAAGQAITGVDGDTSGPPVTVKLIGQNGQLSALDGVPVTLSESPEGGLSGTTTSQTDDGVATFSGISIRDASTYRLTASSPGWPSATSDSFTVNGQQTTCKDNEDCEATLAYHSSTPAGQPYTLSFTLFAPENPDLAVDGGVFDMAWNTVQPLDCAGHDPIAVDRAVFSGVNREKFLTYKMDAVLVGSRAAGTFDMCFAAPYQFLTKNGLFAARDFDHDANGATANWYRGLLPTCALEGLFPILPPCVTEGATGRYKDAAGNGYLHVRLPASSDDPAARG